MTDITKCSGEECPMRELCFRYLAVSEGENQTYFMKPPLEEKNELPYCESFWLIKKPHSAFFEHTDYLTKLLNKEHEEGYKSGGSGHLSHISVKLLHAKTTTWKDRNLLLFMYQIIIDSEFGGVENWIAEIAELNKEQQIGTREKLRQLTENYRDDLGM